MVTASVKTNLSGVILGACALFVLCQGPTHAQTAENFGLMTPEPTGEVGDVTWALPYSEPETLDWIYAWDYGAQNTILANLCEGLRRSNPDGSIGFALATSVETPDNLTYVYKLREGVSFFDGTPMTAEDVAFSLERHRSAEPASYWGLWYQNVKEIAVTGPMEVTIRLTQPDVLFDELMSTPVGYVGKKSFIENAGADYGTAGGGVMCTGPFQLGAWNPGQDITLTRNANYWDPALKPKAGSIRFVSIVDPSGMAAALTTGEADGAWAMATTILPSLQASGTGNLYMNASSEVVLMQPLSLEGALADKRIREALRAAIDYQGIVAGILGGAGETTATLSTKPVWGDQQAIWEKYFGTMPQPAQDMDRAKALVAEAGGQVAPIVIAVNADDVQIISALTVIQNQAASVGLTIEIRKYPPQEFYILSYDPAARAGLDLMANMVSSDIASPLELFSQIVPGAPYNFSNFSDDAFTAPVLASLKEPDAGQRAELNAQAEQALFDGAYYLPLYAPYARVYMGEGITGVPVSTLSQLYYPWAAMIGQR